MGRSLSVLFYVLIFIHFFFVVGTHPAVLMAYSWLCAQGLLMVGSGVEGANGVQDLKLGQSSARQAPYPTVQLF